jgi:CubicO group peptidase (beta-lactamase class C family)
MTYADAMQARVFEPLGMTTAYIRLPTSQDVKLATGYTRFGDGSFHTCHEIEIRSSDAAGMGVMTASDVIVWDEAVRAKQLVQGSLAQAMFMPNGLPLPQGAGLPGDSYAMGWFYGRFPQTRGRRVRSRRRHDPLRESQCAVPRWSRRRAPGQLQL